MLRSAFSAKGEGSVQLASGKTDKPESSGQASAPVPWRKISSRRPKVLAMDFSGEIGKQHDEDFVCQAVWPGKVLIDTSALSLTTGSRPSPDRLGQDFMMLRPLLSEPAGGQADGAWSNFENQKLEEVWTSFGAD